MTTSWKLETSIRLMRKGWTTAMQSALAGGVLSLSQRVGELERDGMLIMRKWVETSGGARVRAYRIVRPTRWTA